MSDADNQLARLRREIDAVDDQLHDLVMRRAALVHGVVEAKRAENAPRSYLRPGREASILRRLVARHEGSFPTGALVRMWRELLCAMLPVQGPFSIAVGGDGTPLWDTARDFYGSDTAMRRLPGAAEAIEAVASGEDALGVFPAGDDAGPRALLALGAAAPRIVNRLPFAAMRGDAGPRADAFVVSRDAPEESGDDVTVLAFEGDGDPRPALAAAGIGAVAWRPWPGLVLAEIRGFHDGGAGRRFDSGGLTARVLGAYPAPLAV